MIRKFPRHHYADDKIYHALTSLMQEKDYKDITIADIARKAGLARMTFYRNYTDKDSVLIKRFVQIMGTVYNSVCSEPNANLTDSWEEIIRIMKDEPIGQLLKDADLLDKAFVVVKDYFMNTYPAFNTGNASNTENRMLLYRHLGEMFGCLMYCSDHHEPSGGRLIANHLADVSKDIGVYT